MDHALIVASGFGGAPDLSRYAQHAAIASFCVVGDCTTSPVSEEGDLRATSNIYAERSRKQCLTGEWIIYAQHEGQNYYLCLAQHDEDADAFERIKRGCVDEFPFLRSQLNLIE